MQAESWIWIEGNPPFSFGFRLAGKTGRAELQSFRPFPPDSLKVNFPYKAKLFFRKPTAPTQADLFKVVVPQELVGELTFYRAA